MDGITQNDLISNYLARYPLAKKVKKDDLALPSGPRQNFVREDGSVKGQGYYGPLPTGRDGAVATELGIGVNFGGREREIPSIVPGLTKEQLNLILSGERPDKAIIDTAVNHAVKRMKSGLSVWAD